MLLTSKKTDSPLEKQYYDIVNPKYLDWDYIKNYINKKPPFGMLGVVVYLRTYSRFIPELKRREHWWETVLRVVEYSMSLFPNRPRVPYSEDELRSEAQDLYDCIFNMNVFPAGRTLFTGGANIQTGDSQFNCAFRVVDSIKAFTDALHLLMNGCGVGFSVERRYVEKLPVFSSHLEVEHLKYKPIPKRERQEQTTTTSWSNGHATIVIGDSKEGWVHALSYFMHAFISGDAGLNKITLVYDNIRGEGEKLRTFGGRASGPKPLRKAFEKIETIIKGAPNGVLSSVDAMDIMNAIAEAVVVGGVRRSSQIAFGDVDDIYFIEAKLNLWSDPDKADKRATRVLSNNSVTLWEKPSKDVLIEIFERIKNNGEPGISIAGNAAKRRPNYKGSNPCHEILLDNMGVCNLTTINMAAFVTENGAFNMTAFLRAIYHAVRMGSRITNVNMWDEEWDYIQKRDRLLGVSLTGQMDCWERMGVEFDSETAINILRTARSYAREIADRYHHDMGIPTSLLITTTKPEGTISQLPTVSSGVHASYAPFYKRRIRISKSDPMALALRDAGMEPTPENGQGDDLDGDDCLTWVFTFPVKTSAKFRSIDEPAIRQLDRYKAVMDHYVDHTCSITVTVAEHEWDEVVDWVYDNWDSCVGIAFLPRFDPSEPGNMYPQMPYETCTESEYNELASSIDIDEEELISLISLFEAEYEEGDVGSDCNSKGFCPVR